MKLKHLITVFCLCALFITPAAAAGGSGTAASPYIIETAAELQAINNDLSAYYQLANDIDLTGVTWTPLGSTTLGFHGTLDGNDKTISNLNLSSTAQSAGLFGSLTSGAVIKDLTLADCHVTSTSSWCGTLAGSIIMSDSAQETATIQDVKLVRCSATTNSDIVGNIIGYCASSNVDIIDCTVSRCVAESTEMNNVGNVIGNCLGVYSTHISGVTVEYSRASSMTYNAANIIGYCNRASYAVNVEDSKVISCIAECTNGYGVGNVISYCYGDSSATVENTLVLNSIAKAASSSVGGIIGLITNSAFSASGCTVKDCTVVATGNYAGGIAGCVQSSATGVFTNNTVSGCSILANAYAAGVCPAYS